MVFPYSFIILPYIELSNSYNFLIIAIEILASFIIAIANAIQTAKKTGGVRDAAKINSAVKLIHIPAYIFWFLISVGMGFTTGIGGLFFVILAIAVDTLTIILTGISSVGCAVRMYKDGYCKLRTSVVMGIGSFIYCIDVVIAILYIVMLKKRGKLSTAQEAEESSLPR